MKKGVEMIRNRGIAAIYKEMRQFSDRKVVLPLAKIEITPEVKLRALGYLMFLTEK